MHMRPRVHTATLPADSALWQRHQAGDFLDCFVTEADATPRRAAEVITAFPGWTAALLRLRRLFTAPFGLSQDGPDAPDKVGPFPVISDTDEELIAGFDDKHLEFQVSVLRRDGQIYLATWVHPHNIGGWAYLAAIYPFHVLVARDALRRVAMDRAASGPAGAAPTA
ncbi:MAG: DUF2867 domain-containing protein [Pseudomonadota bacterium]